MREVRILLFGAVLIGAIVPIFRFLEVMLDTVGTYLQNKIALRMAAESGDESESGGQTFAIGFAPPSSEGEYDDEEG